MRLLLLVVPVLVLSMAWGLGELRRGSTAEMECLVCRPLVGVVAVVAGVVVVLANWRQLLLCLERRPRCFSASRRSPDSVR